MTLVEVLVIPYRKNDLKLAARYEELLTRRRGIRLVDVDQCLVVPPMERPGSAGSLRWSWQVRSHGGLDALRGRKRVTRFGFSDLCRLSHSHRLPR